MSTLGSYPTRTFKESQKFLVLDPETQSASLVSGRDLVEYITPQSNYVFAEQSRAVAQNEDYQIGALIQTAGDLTAGDNFAGTFLVVPGGDGDFPMANGNDLLIIRGDILLREQLALSPSTGQGATLVNGATIYVGSVAELEALSLAVGTNVYLTQDGRAGDFVVKSGTPPSDPQKGIYIVLANGNYAERQYKGPVYADWFGAVGDGVADDYIPINSALLYVGSLGGGVVLIDSPSDYLIGTTLNIPENCSLSSIVSPIGSINGAPGVNNFRPRFYLKDPTTTIILNNSSKLSGLCIFRSGLIFGPTSAEIASNWVGTAVTLKNDTTDHIIEDCSIFGFEYGVRSEPGATNCSRVRIDRLSIDCKNGVLLENSFDISYLNEVHCWPYLTVASVDEGMGEPAKRPGAGIRLLGVNDWTKVTNCFSYGYAKGFWVSGARSALFHSCGADHTPASLLDGSIGFLIDGGAYEITLSQCQTAAKQTGFRIDSSAPELTCTLSDCWAWSFDQTGIDVVRGSAKVIGGMISGNPGTATNGVFAYDTSSSTTVLGTNIKNVEYAFSATNNQVRLTHSLCDFSNLASGISQNAFISIAPSASTLQLNGIDTVFSVSGTVNISAISNAAAYSGKTVTLIFQSALTVTDSASLLLNGNFITASGSTLTLTSDGFNFFETSRSSN